MQKIKKVREALKLLEQLHVNGPTNYFKTPTALYGLDKALGLNIYDDRFRNIAAENDNPLPYSERVYINFNEYTKYLIIETIDEVVITSALNEFREMLQVYKFEFEISPIGGKSFLKIQLEEFIDFIYLVQKIHESKTREKEVFVTGVLINRFDISKSVYIVNEPSGNHINSLVGKDFSNNPFTIYLMDDFEDGDFLGYESELIVDDPISLIEIIENIEKIKFIN